MTGSYGYHRGRCPALMTAGRTEVKRMADEKRRTGLFNRLFGRRDPVFQAPAAPEKPKWTDAQILALADSVSRPRK